MKRVKVYDIRHYDRDMVNQPDEQLPSAQGEWEATELSKLLTSMNVQPTAMYSSPQPRAWRMAEMVNAMCQWNLGSTRVLDSFNDISSDEDAVHIIVLAKRLAKMIHCPTDAALLLHAKALLYMWSRSDQFLDVLDLAVRGVQNNQSIAIFSHGGQIEMRFLRLLLAMEGIPLSEQTSDLIDIGNLINYGGMLRTGEGFCYTLVLDDGNNFITIEDPDSIRLPEVPAEIKALCS